MPRQKRALAAAGFSFLVLFGRSPDVLAEVLKLRAGGDLNAGVSALDAETVTLIDGRTLPRSAVGEIDFAEKKTEPAATRPDLAAQSRGRELFLAAEEFGKRHPGTDGLVLVDEGEFVVHPDGTWTERDRFAGKILKEGLKQSWGQVSRSFEEGRERVKILKATVYRPDGRVFSLEPARIKVSQPQGDAQFFQDTRMINYELSEVETGSIVETEVETETYNPFRKDFFFPRWGFGGGSPETSSRLTITVPSSQKLYYSARNFTGDRRAGAEPKVATKDGLTTYAWELRDIPEIVAEPLMVPYWDYVPGVKASLFTDWDRIYDWLGQMYRDRTNASPELAAFTRELVKGCRTDDERAAAIYHYIQRDIRYISVKVGAASGWGGYDANLTWKRRFGCCIDKALLFTAMLKAVGIRSTPVLLDPNSEAEHDFGTPDIWFAHAITYLTVAGRSFFLDSTGYDYRYPSFPAMDHGVKVLDVFDRDARPIPTPKPEQNASRLTYSVELDKNGGAFVRFSSDYNGSHEGELRGYYKSIKESELKKFFQNWVNDVSPLAELVDYKLEGLDDVSKPFTMAMTYRLKDYLIRAGDLSILKLPDFDLSYEEVALARRRYALQYQTAVERRYRYEISLPPGLRAASVPKPAKILGPGESFELACADGGARIVCDAVERRSRRVYPTSDYAAHKAFAEKVSRLAEDRLFLRAAAP